MTRLVVLGYNRRLCGSPSSVSLQVAQLTIAHLINSDVILIPQSREKNL